MAFEDSDENGNGDGIRFEVELSDLKDYTVFRRKLSTIGTTVTLQLNGGIVVDDVFEQTQKQLLCSEIELTLAIDQDEIKMPRTPPGISDEDLLSAKLLKKKELGIETFSWSGSLENTEPFPGSHLPIIGWRCNLR